MLYKLPVAGVIACVASLLATPALAGRGTQIDAPVGYGTCFFGASSCGAVDLSGTGVVIQRAYIYQEGIVSLNSLLPITANASDPSTFGSGDWFTPGISAGTIYSVNAYRSIGFDIFPPSWGLNFFIAGSSQLDSFGSPRAPDMQVQLASGTGLHVVPAATSGPWDGISAALAYGPGIDPPANAFIGFNWGSAGSQIVRNADGLLVGNLPTDTDFVSTRAINIPSRIIINPEGPPTIIPASFSAPTRFTALYANVAVGGVPEPGTWAMMLVGFGAVGARLRRRPRAIALAA